MRTHSDTSDTHSAADGVTPRCFMHDKGQRAGCMVGWGRVGRGEFAFYLADVGNRADGL